MIFLWNECIQWILPFSFSIARWNGVSRLFSAGLLTSAPCLINDSAIVECSKQRKGHDFFPELNRLCNFLKIYKFLSFVRFLLEKTSQAVFWARFDVSTEKSGKDPLPLSTICRLLKAKCNGVNPFVNTCLHKVHCHQKHKWTMLSCSGINGKYLPIYRVEIRSSFD